MDEIPAYNNKHHLWVIPIAALILYLTNLFLLQYVYDCGRVFECQEYLLWLVARTRSITTILVSPASHKANHSKPFYSSQ